MSEISSSMPKDFNHMISDKYWSSFGEHSKQEALDLVRKDVEKLFHQYVENWVQLSQKTSGAFVQGHFDDILKSIGQY